MSDPIEVNVSKETVNHLLGVIEKRTDHYLTMKMTSRCATINALYDVIRVYERKLFNEIHDIIVGGK